MSLTDFERIERTVGLRDPARDTVLVGGAAITAHFMSRGVSSEGELADVDVLCPQVFFDNLLQYPASTSHAHSFRLRWPKGGLKARGATNMSIDISPDLDTQRNGVVPFTACVSMGDLMYPMDFDKCVENFESEACGLRVMSLSEILRWISIIGRAKDLDKVNRVMPEARRLQLVNHDEAQSIENEYLRSVRLRGLFPERYYARLDQSLVDAQYPTDPQESAVLQ